MTNEIPPEVVEKLIQLTVPRMLTLIEDERSKNPDAVAWGSEMDARVAALASVAYVLGLQHHLVLDKMESAKNPPKDLGGMFA